MKRYCEIDIALRFYERTNYCKVEEFLFSTVRSRNFYSIFPPLLVRKLFCSVEKETITRDNYLNAAFSFSALISFIVSPKKLSKSYDYLLLCGPATWIGLN